MKFRNTQKYFDALMNNLLNRFGLSMQSKLIIIFLLVKVIPLLILVAIAAYQIINLGHSLKEISVHDSTAALNKSAVESIERLTTDTARNVANFLYMRDSDILFLSNVTPSQAAYQNFAQNSRARVVKPGKLELSQQKDKWIEVTARPEPNILLESSNPENNDMDGFNYRGAQIFDYLEIPLYDQIAFIDLEGNEIFKYTTPDSPKKHYPLSKEKKNISRKENTYVKAEEYFEELKKLKPGEIYVSDVIGAYVGTNYIGMYVPGNLEKAAKDRGFDIPFEPETQAYAGEENPNGQRFEGIIRWATPVVGPDGKKTGYVTFALNHDHIMEFVDRITPMNERYVEIPSAFEGNYAFIWDYKCRSICHPRHHSIVGFDPSTGEPQVPWLESSIYDAWQDSGIKKWTEFVKDIPLFYNQSRKKKPAPALTKAGLVGLDGRYLNNAPQCTGWMDLTQNGGSGSFYILWSGLYKLTTAAAIPYYTGQYAPSENNGYSKRGFAFVTIGAGLDDFTQPARETEAKLVRAISVNLKHTIMHLTITTLILIFIVVLIAIWLAWSITDNITNIIRGISRFRRGERNFRFNNSAKDEFGMLMDSFDEMADGIVNSAKNALSITDAHFKIIYMNRYALELIGKKQEDVINHSYFDYSIYPHGSKYDPLTSLKEGKEADIMYIKESGRYIKGKASYFKNRVGAKMGYIIETFDVTEMVLERNTIEEQRTLLDKIFSASPDLIWYSDPDGKYLAVNPRFADIAGRLPSEFIGKSARDMFPSELAEIFEKNDAMARGSKTPLYTEERIIFADKHEEFLDAVRTPIHYDESGVLVGILGFARNVSERVAIEHELRETQINLEEAAHEANEANKHKGEFLARMSHEIRTPMNAILGLTTILQKKIKSMDSQCSELKSVKGHIDQIESSSRHLLGLLNDILDLSKIEAGKIELSEEKMDLPELINTVSVIIKPRCEEKNIKFSVYADEFSPRVFLTDPLRLRQVLINFLGNSVKFTPELGSIDFTIKNLGRKEGKMLVKFSVKDSGIGMSEKTLDNLFKPFEQGSDTITGRYGGTGLGLAISRHLVRLFGGDIQVITELGKGSEFSFEIWFKETEAEKNYAKNISDATDKFKGKKALLVDDVEINRMIVISLLEPTGIEITEADNGLNALEKFKASAKGEYDIIFMDVQMPVMGGYEAAGKIRSLKRTDAKTVPIVALTANAFKEDIDKAKTHGMNDHITKPVELNHLLKILFKYIPLK
ncbi:MAG: ATP-binding protein [Endomicrobia bacterium]|nr:ATP-binding protein [Endomicrobiia bacterium]MCL2799624.1 ATP-binding protein [Endomicrobiia bacterium]